MRRVITYHSLYNKHFTTETKRADDLYFPESEKAIYLVLGDLSGEQTTLANNRSGQCSKGIVYVDSVIWMVRECRFSPVLYSTCWYLASF